MDLGVNFKLLHYITTLVRSHLEYANYVWNPYRIGLMKDLEEVQMRATKLVSTGHH